MFRTKVSWNEYQVVAVIGAISPIIIRMNNDEAIDLYNQLSLRAANKELFNKDGSFTVSGRVYELTAGQWASIFRPLEDWYSQFFDAHIADELFGEFPDGSSN